MNLYCIEWVADGDTALVQREYLVAPNADVVMAERSIAEVSAFSVRLVQHDIKLKPGLVN